MSREPPPPLPGGYTVGEQVYYTGAGGTLESGDRVVHGQQGKGVGPVTLESHEGKGVAVRFPGNKGAINCLLDQVRRHRRHAAARSSPPAPQLPLLPAHPRCVARGRNR